MTEFSATPLISTFSAVIQLGTSTAGSPVPIPLSGSVSGIGNLTGQLTVVDAGAITLSGSSIGLGDLIGDLTISETDAAPTVREMISVGGDSWTEGNTSKISRNPPTVQESDRWDYQAAATMGIPNYTSPTQASSSPTGIINNGYGGQSSGTIYKNIAAVVANDAGRLEDIWTWWGGRNDVTKPGGDVWPAISSGDYETTITANITAGSTVISAIVPASVQWDNLAISGPGIAPGTTISVSSAGGNGTLSQVATSNQTGATFTISARGAKQFLELIPHDRKLVMIPYGGGNITSSTDNWHRWNRAKWAYRREFRRHLLEMLPNIMSRSASDQSDTELNQVAAQSLLTSLTYQDHPNYNAVPKIASAIVPVFRALQNRGVYVLPQTIPDVPYDMAAGEKLEVYFKGHVTEVAISADDPLLPGLFTIAMKAGSHSVAELTRTTVSPGNISRILNLGITATGKDINGSTVTHTGTVRILPSAIGAASTIPVGAYLRRDPNVTAAVRRWPRLSGFNFDATKGALTIVTCLLPDEDATNLNLVVAGSNIIVNRTSGNRLAIVVRDSANTTVLNWSGSAPAVLFNKAGGYTWLALSIDLPSQSVKVWAGRDSADTDLATGASGSQLTVAANTGMINWGSSMALFAAGVSGASSFVGSVRSFWMDQRYIDFSIEANRRKFWNADGSPVDLGPNGSAGLTTPPLFYQRGAPGDWVTGKNFGSGVDAAWNDQWLLGNDSDPLPATVPGQAAVSSFEVMGATPLDATGDYGDVTSRPGIEVDGWVAKITMPFISGAVFDPSKIVVNVSDPGYDAAGSTTRTRTIRGTAKLRRQYPNQASIQETSSGGVYTAYFALSDHIYAATSIVSVVAESGFYGVAANGSVPSPVNSSALAYPKPIFEWLNAQHDVERGASTYRWEAVAYHGHMQLGRQVARIEVTAKDTSGNESAPSVVAATALSQMQVRGDIVESFQGEIDLSNLNAGELCIANARVYPWIGDESAVLDLVRDGISTSGPVQTANPQTPLRFVCDKDGSYTGAYAYVKAGATGGLVSADPATARATPFPTINAALAAIPAWNNANKGHNDHSGAKIRLMDDGAGGNVAHVITAHLNTVPAGHCLTDIESDPLNTGAVSVNVNAAWRTADRLRWRVKLTQGSATSYLNGNNANGYVQQVVENEDLDVTAATNIPLFMQVGLLYLRNPKIVGAGTNAATCMAGYATTRTQCAQALGVEMDPTANVSVKPFATIGCRFTRTVLLEHTYGTIPNWDEVDGMVVANNSFLNCQVATTLFRNTALSRGFAFVQNVLERAVTGTSAPALQIGADGSGAALRNLVFAYNTIPGTDTGCRLNVAYTDTAAAVGVDKVLAFQRFNVLAQYNCKTDTFTTETTALGRAGNWQTRYTVGHIGWVSIQGDATGASAAGPDNFLGDYLQSSIAPKAGANVTFADDKSGSAGIGGGTYTLTGASNAAYDRVPSGLAGLSFDLAGNARRNDGSGAAGAYERAA